MSIAANGNVVMNNDLVVNGNTGQPSDKNGLMKAMLLVRDNSSDNNTPGVAIEKCYDGVANRSFGTCGFSISTNGNLGVYITFPFVVADRFFSVTLSNPRGAEAPVVNVDPNNRNRILVMTDINSSFYLIVY